MVREADSISLFHPAEWARANREAPHRRRDDIGGWVGTVRPMIDRIAWATVAVADQDVMKDFFVDVLGFSVKADSEMWPGARWLEVAPPNAETSLVLSKAGDFGKEPDSQYPIGLVSGDLLAVVAAARRRGLDATDPASEGWGTFVRVTDPEGRDLLVRASE